MNKRGFTLIEMTVSMTIFAAIISIAVGLFVLIVRIQLQNQAVRAVQQSMRFSFEEFFREVRLAQGFYDFDASDMSQTFSQACAGLPKGFEPRPPKGDGPGQTNLLTPGRFLTIKSFKGELITYKIQPVSGLPDPLGQQNVFVAFNRGNVCRGTPPTPIVTRLTAVDVSVTDLMIYRDSKNSIDEPPALITMVLSLRSFPNVPKSIISQTFTAQETVSLRGEIKNFFPGIE